MVLVCMALKWAVLIAVSGFLLQAAITVAGGLGDDGRRGDLAVVPGNRIDPDGRPGKRLAPRLDRALELYRDGRVKAILVSGGKGAEGFEEADVMRDDLVSRGVPASDVIVDRDGYDTWRTARSAAAVMRAHGWRSAIVVSQYWHLRRAKLALRRHGIDDVRVARSNFVVDPMDLYSIPRDMAGWWVYRLRRDR